MNLLALSQTAAIHKHSTGSFIAVGMNINVTRELSADNREMVYSFLQLKVIWDHHCCIRHWGNVLYMQSEPFSGEPSGCWLLQYVWIWRGDQVFQTRHLQYLALIFILIYCGYKFVDEEWKLVKACLTCRLFPLYSVKYTLHWKCFK